GVGGRWRALREPAHRARPNGVIMPPRGDAPSRFPYYRRLSAADKRTYRASDAVTAVEVPDAAGIAPAVEAFRVALVSQKRLAVERAAQALCRALCVQLSV